MLFPITYCNLYNNCLGLFKFQHMKQFWTCSVKLICILLFVNFHLLIAQTNVTFQVDMSQQSGFTTPEVNGTFNNWCGSSCNPLSDINSDGVWETTIQLTPGNYEYKFAADNWTTQETLLPGSPCTVSNFGFTNRTLVVGTSDITLPVVCWGSCSACVSNTPLTITVDLCGQSAQQVRMTGSFWNWAPNAGPVAVNNGNSTWKFTLNPPPSTSMDYLIVVDSVYENLITEMQNGATCAPLTDYSTFANRVWTPGSTDSLLIYYNRCSACPTGIIENNHFSFQLFPNPASNYINITKPAGTHQVSVYNFLGEIVFSTSSDQTELQLNASNLPSGQYLVRISSDEVGSTSVVHVE